MWQGSCNPGWLQVQQESLLALGVGSRLIAKADVPKALVGEVVRKFGEVRLRVFGTSMVPAILPGDLIFIQRADLQEISVGEIVLFTQNDRLFVHRVVSIGGDPESPCLLTRGDRLGHYDPPVISSQLLGRVKSIERGQQRLDPAVPARGYKELALRVLRGSDLATYAYLRFVACWRSLFTRRAECRL